MTRRIRHILAAVGIGSITLFEAGSCNLWYEFLPEDPPVPFVPTPDDDDIGDLGSGCGFVDIW